MQDRSELKHLEHLTSASQVRRADVATVGNKVLVADLDSVATRQTDRVPVAVNIEEAEVLAESEAIERGSGVDDDVKCHLVALGPVLLTRGQETVGAHLAGILLLGSRAGDGPDFGTQSLGEDDTVVTETTDTDDTDLLSRTGAETLQRAVYGDTGAEHGSSLGA
ncbi:hypothetical protein HG531_011365 [Fusarium graminearum]|nr:hypothetical protein HG531_011365 [Fusarium graminearum]